MKNQITADSMAITKADLLISDYTLAGSAKEKDIFLSLAGKYIREIDDPEIELMYNQVCGAGEEKEKELYLEILIDLLDTRKTVSI